MPEYRAYILGQDGQFNRAIDIICPDDEDAKRFAKRLVADKDVELWKGERPIGDFRHEIKSETGLLPRGNRPSD